MPRKNGQIAVFEGKCRLFRLFRYFVYCTRYAWILSALTLDTNTRYGYLGLMDIHQSI